MGGGDAPGWGRCPPLLANILLDDLDRGLERRGHSFCRYADDCNIYVRSQRAGERVMESVAHHLERKLKLRVNREKSGVDRAAKRKFLGLRVIGRGEKARLSIAPESRTRLKKELRRITKRNRGVSLRQVLTELGRYPPVHECLKLAQTSSAPCPGTQLTCCGYVVSTALSPCPSRCAHGLGHGVRGVSPIGSQRRYCPAPHPPGGSSVDARSPGPKGLHGWWSCQTLIHHVRTPLPHREARL